MRDERSTMRHSSQERIIKVQEDSKSVDAERRMFDVEREFQFQTNFTNVQQLR